MGLANGPSHEALGWYSLSLPSWRGSVLRSRRL